MSISEYRGQGTPPPEATGEAAPPDMYSYVVDVRLAGSGRSLRNVYVLDDFPSLAAKAKAEPIATPHTDTYHPP